jgi:shikimate dehydrogenase
MKLAVVGNPIAHTKSPLIFEFLFKTLKLDASYRSILIDDVQKIPLLLRKVMDGLNVTAPFKQDLIPFLDELSVDAIKIGSVNTCLRKEEKLYGFNTDYLGVVNALEENGVSLESKRCLILGAGGAARSAAYGLKKSLAKVAIYNRTEEKSKDLARDFNCDFIKKEDLKKVLRDTEILVDTLPAKVGILNPDSLHSNLRVLDASYPGSVYKDSKIKQLIGGEHWLLHQAIPAFELFFGIKINESDYDREALLALLLQTK